MLSQDSGPKLGRKSKTYSTKTMKKLLLLAGVGLMLMCSGCAVAVYDGPYYHPYPVYQPYYYGRAYYVVTPPPVVYHGPVYRY